MTRNCPKIHFNIVKNYVSAERKVIRHVINDVITNYTEPQGVDTTLDDFIQKTNFKYPYKKGSPAKELPIFLLLVFYSIFQSTLLLSILQSQDL